MAHPESQLAIADHLAEAIETRIVYANATPTFEQKSAGIKHSPRNARKGVEMIVCMVANSEIEHVSPRLERAISIAREDKAHHSFDYGLNYTPPALKAAL